MTPSHIPTDLSRLDYQTTTSHPPTPAFKNNNIKHTLINLFLKTGPQIEM